MTPESAIYYHAVLIFNSIGLSVILIYLLWLARFTKEYNNVAKLFRISLSLVFMTFGTILLLLIDFIWDIFGILIFSPFLFLLPLFFNQIYKLFLPGVKIKWSGELFFVIFLFAFSFFILNEFNFIRVPKLYYHNIMLTAQWFSLSLSFVLGTFKLIRLTDLENSKLYFINYFFGLHVIILLLTSLHLITALFLFNERMLGLYLICYLIVLFCCLHFFKVPNVLAKNKEN